MSGGVKQKQVIKLNFLLQFMSLCYRCSLFRIGLDLCPCDVELGLIVCLKCPLFFRLFKGMC